ncbi:hypothetical protein QBZ16_000921 [Prototheca wickerhamii]|uniref:PB1 domain-containing protein n=1 Tax=Prototheca wickerhamii TaxID=3111 RepID=A0AAD9MM56_PROWI|nr:hypothetical protein QBZ16_000921 [Prototheca wickerhamii]
MRSPGNGKDSSASLAELKEQANIAFAKKEYDQALGLWEQALRLGPGSKAESALLHSNKAAALMAGRKFKDAVKECSSALEAEPAFFRALLRRAKAYEGLGQIKNAVSDLAQANKLDAATPESRAAEARLRAALSGKKPASAAPAAARKHGGVPAARRGARRLRRGSWPAAGLPRPSWPLATTCARCSSSPGITYLELQEHVRQVYPQAAPFVLKFLDREGDLVTIGSRADLQVAMQQCVEAARASGGARPGAPLQLAPIRLQVVRAASEAEVPAVPAEELAYVQQMLSGLQKAAKAQGADEAGASPPVQVDEWILSFVDLLKEHCGIDPDRPLEASETPAPDELLDAATEKFEDQVCFGMYNQASVEQYRAEFLMYRAARRRRAGRRGRRGRGARLDAAERKHREALAYKAGFLDGYLGLSSVAQSRAKLAANYLLEPVKPREDLADAAARAAAEEAANREAQKRVFERVSAASAQTAEPFMEASYAFINQAIEHMPADERAREIRPMKPTAEQVPGDPDSEMPVRASLMINLGNAYYEHSILRAAGGLDWRPLLERAAEQFRAAGAHELDVKNALKGHPMADELKDLIGDDEEAEAPAESAPVAKTEEAKAPKGLPALPKAKAKAKAKAEE